MRFDIKGKYALITGAASGIGLHYVEELLKNGLAVCNVCLVFGYKIIIHIAKI